MLKVWEDIYSWSSIFRMLRKFMDYAVYARKKFEEHRSFRSLDWLPDWDHAWSKCTCASRCQCCIMYREWFASRKLLKVGDDRVRYYRNPMYDDRTVELWTVKYSWVDYSAKFWENEETSLTWVYKPYGSGFDGKRYAVTRDAHKKDSPCGHSIDHISVIEICAAFHQDNPNDCRVPMQNWLQEKVKKRYDNLYARMLFKEMANPKLRECGTRHLYRKGMYYKSNCFPWLTEMSQEMQQVVRGKIKRKHYFSETIDVRDFLEK